MRIRFRTVAVCAAGLALAASAATPPKGPFEPTWDSIKEHYRVPLWFQDGKFGVFMHWGLYEVPAHHNEWYAKHMYGNPEMMQWHTEHFGPLDKFGYKDFVPLFRNEKFDPDQWAELFRKAGVKYVVPTAEHHDGFAMYDSDLTKWCATKMGPKRDLIGDLAKAVRKQGLKFGVSNHRMEHWSFMYSTLDAAQKSDLFDPKFADFYGPPHPPRTPESKEWLDEWAARVDELIDKYQPDMLWFDNGINARRYDPVKLAVAAYYYNRATEWKKEVTLSTKDSAYLSGSILDFERAGRAPKVLQANVWQTDDPIGDTFGYTTEIKYKSAGSLVKELIDNVSKNGNLLLNLSPKADGTIPEEQQKILLEIGTWLDVNGEAIYGTRPWTIFGEGPSVPESGSPAAAPPPPGPLTASTPRLPAPGSKDFRFTTKGDVLYAIDMGWPGEEATIASLAKNKIKSVELLGNKGPLEFTQDEGGLRVKFPADKPCDYAYALKITGLKLK